MTALSTGLQHLFGWAPGPHAGRQGAQPTTAPCAPRHCAIMKVLLPTSASPPARVAQDTWTTPCRPLQDWSSSSSTVPSGRTLLLQITYATRSTRGDRRWCAAPSLSPRRRASAPFSTAGRRLHRTKGFVKRKTSPSTLLRTVRALLAPAETTSPRSTRPRGPCLSRKMIMLTRPTLDKPSGATSTPQRRISRHPRPLASTAPPVPGPLEARSPHRDSSAREAVSTE